jgi:hypothetical protein
MGKNKGVYQEEFPVGSVVRIADRQTLEKFMAEWKFHHPLEPSQLQFAGRRTEVERVNFYHGGDELYELKRIPGIWHESCLEADNLFEMVQTE